MFANSDEFQFVSRSTLDEMAREATQSERKRVHLLLHAGHSDQVQRLIIVTQPDTYVRPHCHPEQWEMLILLQGRGDLLRFDPDGQIAERAGISASAPVVQIPAGVWHSFWVLEPGTAIMEAKPGPYRPSEFAAWAPPEGDVGVAEYLRRLAPQHLRLREADRFGEPCSAPRRSPAAALSTISPGAPRGRRNLLDVPARFLIKNCTK
jgi:cupin fold WbuC family metalloprotein